MQLKWRDCVCFNVCPCVTHAHNVSKLRPHSIAWIPDVFSPTIPLPQNPFSFILYFSHYFKRSTLRNLHNMKKRALLTLHSTIPMMNQHCQNILQYRLQFVFQLINAIFKDSGRYTFVHLPVRFPNVCKWLCGPGSSVGIATYYRLDGPGSNPGGHEIFRPSRPALGPIQPPVQWLPGLSRG